MVAVNMHDIEKSYGIIDVLQGFSLNLNQGEKAALIGPNGSGKTTVLKIIAGLETYDSGNLAVRNGLKLGYLEQIPELDSGNTLYEELETTFEDIIEMEEKMSRLEQQISDAGSQSNSDPDKLMKKYSEIQERFNKKGGYGYRSQIKQVALGLGFTHEELEQKVGIFSGGEKTRIGLVKLLLSRPDILLLDEPTNHLDIPSRQWLENYLLDYEGTVLIVSHDRYFLDHVIERIIELKQGTAEIYHGNYSYYLEERKQRYQKRLKAYKNQQKKIKKMKNTIERLKVWGRSSDNAKHFRKAKSIQKKLDKMDKLEKPTLGGKKINLEFNIPHRSGDEVLMIEGLSKSFGDKSLLKNVEMKLYWGETAAIIGRNGTGKTTLLQMIVDPEQRYNSNINIGINVKIGYYSQESTDLKQGEELISAFRRYCPMSRDKARDLLASFHFTGDDVFKKISSLSGGEKSRLRLLQLMYGDYNFLIFDEPTNHLDLPSREVLEKALSQYSGTVLVVSHDRYFINKFIDYTYELTREGKLEKYYGNYDYYRKKKAKNEESEQTSVEAEQKKDNKDNFYYRKKKEERRRRQHRRRLQEIESGIMELENEIEELEEKMTAPENLDNYDFLKELKQEYRQKRQKLEKLYEEWEEQLELMSEAEDTS